MVKVKRVVLDVLKPHEPNGLAFSTSLAERTVGARVRLTVTAVDEKTETVVLVIEGEALEFDDIRDAITTMGGSIHSIDEVEVEHVAAAK